MMYLSRIRLNQARRGARRLLGSPHTMHGAVMASFQEAKRDLGRVLWRVDNDPGSTWLYVVSLCSPDFTHIVEEAGWPASAEGWITRSYESLLDQLAIGQRWAFRLTANPSRSDTSEGGRRFGHVTATQQEQWLLGRASKWGFSVTEAHGQLELVVRDRVVDRFRRADGSVTLAKATFEGILEVSSVESLRGALINGVGHGKAYGCGLITLAQPLARRR